MVALYATTFQYRNYCQTYPIAKYLTNIYVLVTWQYGVPPGSAYGNLLKEDIHGFMWKPVWPRRKYLFYMELLYCNMKIRGS